MNLYKKNIPWFDILFAGIFGLVSHLTVPVYVDHKNYDNYFVDVDALAL